MFRFFDRYILREIAPPFGVGLLLTTFVLLMNQILVLSELFIAKGVSLGLAAEVLVYLIPSLLAFAVPMAVLMGILAGLSRLSTDSEITAFRTLGISSRRLAWPILLFAFAGWLVTSYLTLFLAPRANYKWVQTITGSVLAKVQVRIVPREFNETVPRMVLYIQEIDRDKTWRNVFVYLTKEPGEPRLILAREGRLDLYPETKKATLVLTDGTVHSYPLSDPEKYSITSFKRLEEGIDVEGLFASVAGRKRVREKDIFELREGVRELQAAPAPAPGKPPAKAALGKPAAAPAEVEEPGRARPGQGPGHPGPLDRDPQEVRPALRLFHLRPPGPAPGHDDEKGGTDERLHGQHRHHPALLHPHHGGGEAGHGRPGDAVPGDVGPEHHPLRRRTLSLRQIPEGEGPPLRSLGTPPEEGRPGNRRRADLRRPPPAQALRPVPQHPRQIHHPEVHRPSSPSSSSGSSRSRSS